MVVIKDNFHKGPYIFRCRHCETIFECDRDELTSHIAQNNLLNNGLYECCVITYILQCPCCGASYGYGVSDILEENPEFPPVTEM